LRRKQKSTLLMAQPTNQAQRCVEKQRLAYYLDAADTDFWERHWRMNFSAQIYAEAEQGRLDPFEMMFTHYLPKPGRILEAGCGLGQYVMALQVRGYDVEGVEWGAETVQAVRALYPYLPIRVGDVTRLEVPDGWYSGYISLGVVEHCQAGPELFLQEAWRVLEMNGAAFFSVPYFHPLRRLKARLGLYRGRPDGLKFYQYAFTEADFSACLRSAGFRIVGKMPYGGFKGVRDEFPALRRVASWRGVGWRLERWLRSSEWVERNLGHMILFVCRKAQARDE
jgi:SAM-dependent methyltransferase